MRAPPSTGGPLLAVLAIAVVLLLGGCGDDKDASPTSAEPPGSASPSGLTTSPVSLSSALLTVADLPNVWQLGGSKTFAPGTPFCGLSLPTDLDPQESVSSTFTNKRNGFVLAQYLSRYEEGEATKVVAAYRKTIEPCSEWKIPAPDGGEANYRVSVLPTSGLGDETFGFGVTLDLVLTASPRAGETVTLQMHIVLTRRGNVLNWLAYGGLPLEELALEETEELAQLAYSKLR